MFHDYELRLCEIQRVCVQCLIRSWQQFHTLAWVLGHIWGWGRSCRLCTCKGGSSLACHSHSKHSLAHWTPNAAGGKGKRVINWSFLVGWMQDLVELSKAATSACGAANGTAFARFHDLECEQMSVAELLNQHPNYCSRGFLCAFYQFQILYIILLFDIRAVFWSVLSQEDQHNETIL